MFRNVPGCSMFLVLSTPSWVLEQGFLDGNFQVNVTWFLPFSPRVSLTELCSWYGLKDLFTNCTSQRTKLSFIIKTDDVTSGRRDVNGLNNYSSIFFVCIQSLTHDTRRIWSTQTRLFSKAVCLCSFFIRTAISRRGGYALSFCNLSLKTFLQFLLKHLLKVVLQNDLFFSVSRNNHRLIYHMVSVKKYS